MFWGITLEHGKVYSQIVEMPFHISMAALGFSNITTHATTVMVESDKADYALCTLQAGKIPQQPLDLNFTEGEEVKFYLEGDGGDVHLTGYLLDTPREYEFDEDDDEEIDGLLSSDEEASSLGSEEEETAENDDSDDEKESMKNEDGGDLDGVLDEKEGNDKDSEEGKNATESEEDDSGDSDFGEESISWQAALTGDVDLDDVEDNSDSEDNEWKPVKKKAMEKEGKVKKKRLAAQKKAVGKTRQKPISQTLVDLMDMGDSDESSESDNDWTPEMGNAVDDESKTKDKKDSVNGENGS